MANEMMLVRDLNGTAVRQRESDGYVNGTELCKAADRRWNDYWSTDAAKAFVGELSSITGIPVIELVQVVRGRPDLGGGTWVHPDVAVHLAQWCSARFAVLVSRWVRELLTRGSVTLPQAASVVVPTEQIKEAVRQVLAESRPSNVGPGWTIQQRLAEHRWYGTTRKQREQIRKTVNNLVHTVLGQEIEQLNGTNVYSRGQVHMLDKAIEIVRQETDGRDHGPSLFPVVG